MAESTRFQNSGENKATLTGGLVFCSTLFILLFLLLLLFTYYDKDSISKIQFLNLKLGDLLILILSIPLIPSILIILAIAISILSGQIVYKRNLANIHTTEKDDLKEIWESIYNQENTQSD